MNKRSTKENTMIDLMDTIKRRRSIRKYEDKPVSTEALSQVLEAIRWAPSWANCQCWEVVVVTDKTIKEKLRETLPPKGNPAFKAMVQAPVVLVLCAKTGVSGYYKGAETTKFGDWFMYDLGIATQNLCLAAHALGLGTVIVGLFDHEKAGRVINLPVGYELVTMIPLGHPAKIGSAPKRRSVDDFAHDNIF
ncbi:MAG: nitroreductase family protein [Desulfobacteraceae bacterium]